MHSFPLAGPDDNDLDLDDTVLDQGRNKRSLDEYVGVPPRPGTVEAPVQELSHLGPIAGITVERDKYVGVPPRPGTVEAPGQELSHREPIAGITAERDEYVGVPLRPGTVEGPD